MQTNCALYLETQQADYNYLQNTKIYTNHKVSDSPKYQEGVIPQMAPKQKTQELQRKVSKRWGVWQRHKTAVVKDTTESAQRRSRVDSEYHINNNDVSIYHM